MISVLCPTRNRPDNVRRLLASVWDTAEDAVEVIFYTDHDAPDSVPEDCRKSGVRGVTGPRITLSQTWNECYNLARGDIVMQCGDDIVFRTKGWDTRVAAEAAKYPDGIVLVYGNDLFQGQALATHSFVPRAWVEAVGYFTPSHFSCDYSDQWLFDVAGMVGRRVYLPDVVTEHMHPLAGKALWDQSHAERLQRGAQDQVGLTYQMSLGERERDAAKLKAAIEEAAA